MKFGRSYRQHQAPVWESHYMPYTKLKATLKLVKANGHRAPHKEFLADFIRTISACNTFASRRHSVLQREEKQIEERKEVEVVAGREIQFLARLEHLCLQGLQNSIDELLWFFRVNHEAIVRIIGKLDRLKGNNEDIIPSVAREDMDVQLKELDQKYRQCTEWLIGVQGRLSFLTRVLNEHTAISLDEESENVAAQLRGEYSALNATDVNGRTLLHFGAMHRLTKLCIYELDRVSTSESEIHNAILRRDNEGLTPLHWSISRGHIEVTELLLAKMDSSGSRIPNDLLHIALRREDDAMVRLLIKNSIGLEHLSSSGESSIYIAADLGRDDYFNLLWPVVGPKLIDVAESICKWTPLFIAGIKGHISTVRLLLHAGADSTLTDYLGWTAQENAVFRGHISVGKLFPINQGVPSLASSLSFKASKQMKMQKFKDRPDRAHVIMNLGGLQNRRQSKTTSLVLPDLSSHGLVLQISILGSPTKFERMLPLLDDPVDDTFDFPLEKVTDVVVSFKIFKAGATVNRTSFASGATLLGGLYSALGEHHNTMVREQTVPLVQIDTLEPIGAITFSFIVVGPYPKLRSPTAVFMALEDLKSVELVGHRGLGANSNKRRYLQFGENTIESFLGAGNLGASFVEVHVQLTRDLVPVLFHDYSLSQTGTDVPVHEVTLDQFMHVSNIQSPHGDPPSMIGNPNTSARSGHRSLRRSRSATNLQEKGAEEVRTRMEHTVDFMNRGFKANTRGDFIQDMFATLEEVLLNVPEEIGFDIEVKYPRLHEAIGASLPPIAIDINVFVDTILDTIARCSSNSKRKIILSSFTPQVCIALAMKQRAYPVFFITNAGKLPMLDMEKRAGSLQVAVRFAKQWGLDGIVVAADSVIMCPRLLGYVKSQGLVCGSYNTLNDQPENIEIQVKAGLDLIVADRIKLVSQVLKDMKFQLPPSGE